MPWRRPAFHWPSEMHEVPLPLDGCCSDSFLFKVCCDFYFVVGVCDSAWDCGVCSVGIVISVPEFAITLISLFYVCLLSSLLPFWASSSSSLACIEDSVPCLFFFWYCLFWFSVVVLNAPSTVASASASTSTSTSTFILTPAFLSTFLFLYPWPAVVFVLLVLIDLWVAVLSLEDFFLLSCSHATAFHHSPPTLSSTLLERETKPWTFSNYSGFKWRNSELVAT